MTEEFIFAGLFAIACLARNYPTYRVLLLAAIGSILLYPFTIIHSTLPEFVLDFITAGALYIYADKERNYQIGLLVFAMFSRILMQWDIVNETDFIFNIYDEVITTITVLQLLGVIYGRYIADFKRLWIDHPNDLFTDHIHPKMGQQRCQKKR